MSYVIDEIHSSVDNRRVGKNTHCSRLGSWGKLGRESSDPAEAANRSLALSPADNLGCQLLGRYFELRIVLRPKEAQGMDFSSACPWPSDDLIRTMMP